MVIIFENLYNYKPIQNRMKTDPLLRPYESIISQRSRIVDDAEYLLNCGCIDLVEYVSEHQYFSMHYRNER